MAGMIVMSGVPSTGIQILNVEAAEELSENLEDAINAMEQIILNEQYVKDLYSEESYQIYFEKWAAAGTLILEAREGSTAVSVEKLVRAKTELLEAIANLEQVAVRYEMPEKGAVTTTQADLNFLNSMKNPVVNVVFKQKQAQSAAGAIAPLLTLKDQSGKYFTVWYNAKRAANGEYSTQGMYGYDITNHAQGFQFTSPGGFINDTKWHKLSLTISTNSENKAQHLYGYLDGNKVIDFELNGTNYASAINDFLTQRGTVWNINGVLAGAKAEGAAYQHTMSDFNGAIAYAEVRDTICDSEEKAAAVNAKAGETIQTEYNNLLRICQELKASDYSADSWSAFQTALTANSGKTSEWDIYNAIDALRTAKNNLRGATETTTTIQTATVNVTAPAIGARAAAASTADTEGYTVESTVWKQGNATVQNGAAFEAGKAYSVTVTLAPKANHVFADNATAKVNNENTTASVTGGKLVITKNFAAFTDPAADALKQLREYLDTVKAVYEKNNRKDDGTAIYTEASWNAFKASYEAAKAEIDATSHKPAAEIQALKTALETKYRALENVAVQPVDQELEAARKMLKDALEAAKPVYDGGKQDYTDASWDTFAAAYEAGKNAPDNAGAAALKALAEALTAAQAGLLREEKPGPTDPTPTDPTPTDPTPADPTPVKPGQADPTPERRDTRQIPSNPPVEAGRVYDSGNFRYKVTSVTALTAQVVSLKNTSLTKLKIYNSVKLGGKMFRVTSIAPSAFKNNKKITNVVIGTNVKTIGNNAFAGCTKLKKVTIGRNVKKIGKKSFFKCSRLSSIVVKGRLVKNIGAGAFRKTSAKMTVRLPKKLTKKQRTGMIQKFRKAGVTRNVKMK